MKRLWIALAAVACVGMLHAPGVLADDPVLALKLDAPSQAQVGDPVPLDATVLQPGHVDFVDLTHNTTIASTEVNPDGHAVAAVTSLALGTHDIQAFFRGTPARDSDVVTIVITKVFTAIDATPVVARVSTLSIFLGSLNAVLHRADNGAPLANRIVVFSARGVPICAVKTAANGSASCAGLVPALLGLGYRVTYAGDATHEGAEGGGVLIG